MDRRTAILSLLGTPLAVAGVRATPVPATPKFGVLTLHGWRAHKHLTGESLHVYFAGVDVTERCRHADDVEGVVEVYCRDNEQHQWDVERGGLHIDGGGACVHRLTGDVVIRPGEDF